MLSLRRRRANTLERVTRRAHIEPVALTVLALVMLACGSRRRTAADFIGTYQASDGAVLILHDNGQFAAFQFPLAAVGKLPVEWLRVDGNGEWSVAPPEYKYGDSLRLIYRERSDGSVGTASSLFTGGSGKPTYLYTWLGDPDDSPQYEFERKAE